MNLYSPSSNWNARCKWMMRVAKGKSLEAMVRCVLFVAIVYAMRLERYARSFYSIFPSPDVVPKFFVHMIQVGNSLLIDSLFFS